MSDYYLFMKLLAYRDIYGDTNNKFLLTKQGAMSPEDRKALQELFDTLVKLDQIQQEAIKKKMIMDTVNVGLGLGLSIPQVISYFRTRKLMAHPLISTPIEKLYY